jgi:lysine/ornithine N-monooxygenase
VKNHLGPAGGWFMRDRFIGKVPLVLDRQLEQAEISNGQVHLKFAASDGSSTEVITDHVVAATGYKMDLANLEFLSDDVRHDVKVVERTPVLSSNFESSLPGLYFVGPLAANSFGPVMRFAVGAKFTARQISKHLVATSLSPVTTPREATLSGEEPRAALPS